MVFAFWNIFRFRDIVIFVLQAIESKATQEHLKNIFLCAKTKQTSKCSSKKEKQCVLNKSLKKLPPRFKQVRKVYFISLLFVFSKKY